jgi:chemotaxis protein MotB
MKKKHRKSGSKNSEESSGAGWEVIYTGFVLILLCFFIMLSAFSTMEQAKVMQFVRSFASAMTILPWGAKLDPGTVVMPESADLVDARSALAKIMEELNLLSNMFDLKDDINLSISKEGLVMRLSDHALFDSGIATLSPQGLPLLEKIGNIIARTSYFIRIEGHTDNLPIHTELFPSNWDLSTARAVNVLRYFLQSHHIDAQRLAAVGFGEFQPLAPNDMPANRAKNRRVEIIFITNDPQQKKIEEIS